MGKDTIEIKAIDIEGQSDVKDYGSFITTDDRYLCLVYNFECTEEDENLGIPMHRTAMMTYKYKKDSIIGLQFGLTSDKIWQIKIDIMGGIVLYIQFPNENEEWACAVYHKLDKYVFG